MGPRNGRSLSSRLGVWTACRGTEAGLLPYVALARGWGVREGDSWLSQEEGYEPPVSSHLLSCGPLHSQAPT